METQAQPLRQSRFSVLLARPWASRLLATLGIVVITVGLSVPVVGRDILVDGDFIGSRSDTRAIGDALWAFLQVGHIPLPLQLGFSTVHAVLTLGGLALIPLLWQPLSPKWTAWARRIYAAWLLLLIIFAVVSLPVLWQAMSRPVQGPLPHFITFGAPYLLPGAAVFPLGTLVSCAALALMLREPLPAALPAPAPRTGWQWVAALVLTAGMLVWVIGFYLMPEATTRACPPVIFSVTQFAHGACVGIDSDQVLAAATSSGSSPIVRLLFTAIRNFELLVAMGCITALGGWTRRLSVQTLVWLAAWPLLALGVALVALHGASMVAQRGFHLTFATGTDWHIASGMAVAFAGIALVVLGQLTLWRELVRRAAPLG